MIDALNTEYEKCGWWKTLADDKETLIAIRNQYLNVYRNGCSIAELRFKNDQLAASIHYKYLLTKESSKPYVNCIDGEPQITAHADFFIASLGQINDIKSSTKAYAGVEKVGVHQAILANSNVVDTEIAFGNRSRIDFCAIQEDEGGLFLRFFEAKHYSYTGALRAKNNGKADVIDQLKKYEDTINTQRAELLAAYKESIDVAGEIEGSNVLGKQWARHKLDDLQIDAKPRLVVFGFDTDQKNGAVFKKHMGKLKDKIQSRLILMGDAADITLGGVHATQPRLD